MKVLVIDDAPEIVEVVAICLQLRWAHAQVLAAGSGNRGLEMVATEQPDLVVLDVNLPDMDGFQVLEKIREKSTIPVVMLTVEGKDTDIAGGWNWAPMTSSSDLSATSSLLPGWKTPCATDRRKLTSRPTAEFH